MEMKTKMENGEWKMVVGTTCWSSVAAQQRGPTVMVGVMVGRRCRAAGGSDGRAATRPYRHDGRHGRGGAAAPPGVPMAAQQRGPTVMVGVMVGRRCRAAGGMMAAQQHGPTVMMGVMVGRRCRAAGGMMAAQQHGPTVMMGVMVGRRCRAAGGMMAAQQYGLPNSLAL